MTFIPAILAFPLGGSSFHVLDAIQSGVSKIQVTFNDTPQTTDPSLDNDSLNPNNYILSGPASNAVGSVSYIGSNTVELNLLYPLKNGFWTVKCSDLIKNSGGFFLSIPDAWTFMVGSFTAAEPIPMGSENKSAEDILKDFFNPGLKGPNWDAFLSALSVTEQFLYDSARNSWDQLYLSSASGKYLTQRAGDRGVDRPEGLGLSDENFSKYAISLVNRQLTEIAVLDVLEVFYGIDSVKATSISSLAEPYDIQDGSELSILIDENYSFKVVFDRDLFGIPYAATAIEVAAQITRWANLNNVNAFAISYQDPETNLNYVKIYSGGIGLRSSVRITGGLANDYFHFSSFLDVYTTDPLPQWVITYDSVKQITKFTVNGAGIAINPNLNLVEIGDYVNISGTEFNASNRGSFPITDLSIEYSFETTPQLTMWFEVSNVGSNQTVTQSEESSVSFYRPTKLTTYKDSVSSVIVANMGYETDISIPATSPAVSRELFYAAYLHPINEFSISSFSGKDDIITVTTSSAHGLLAGNTVLLENLVPTIASPSIVAGSAGVSDASQKTIWSELTALANTNFLGFYSKVDDTISVSGYGASLSSGFVTVSSHDWEVLTINTVESSGLRTVNYTIDTVPAEDVAGSIFCKATPIPDTWPALTGLEKGALIVGGFRGTPSYSPKFNADLYQADSNTTATLGSSLNSGHSGHIQLNYNNVPYVMGGMGFWQQNTKVCEKYNIRTSLWETLTPMNKGRFLPGYAQFSNKLLVSGGAALSEGPFLETDTYAIWGFTAYPDAGSGPETSTLTDTAVTFCDSFYNANKNGAIRFGGATSKMQGTPTANMLTLFRSNSFTVEGWFYYENALHKPFFAITAPSTPAVTADNILFAFGASYSDTTKWAIYYDDSSTNRVLIEFSTPYINTIVGDWTHWAVVRTPGTTPSTWKFLLYIDGVLIGTADNQNQTTGGSNCVICIGKDPNVGSYTNTGAFSLSQIRVTNKALTGTDIAYSYKASNGEVFWFLPQSGSLEILPERLGMCRESCEIYDFDLNTWTMTGSMSYARSGHQCVLLPSGEVMAIGGYGYPVNKPLSVSSKLNTCEIWSPITNRWRPTSSLPSDAGGYGWATYSEKLKGIVAGSQNTSNVYLYGIETKKWTKLTEMPNREFSQIVNQDDIIINVGGTDSTMQNSVSGRSALILNSVSYFSGGLNKVYQVESIVSPTVFTVKGDVDYVAGTTGKVLSFEPIADTNLDIAGPFILDPTSPVVTKYRGTLQQNLTKNHTYNTLTLDSVASWPDSGYIIIGFGFDYQTNPIPYYAKYNNTSIKIDENYIFKNNIPTGAFVDVLVQKGPFTPTNDTELGVFYLTDSPSGRTAAQLAVSEIIAAGTDYNILIRYPGDRGLGAEGYSTLSGKLSDIVGVFSQVSSN